MYCRLWIGDRLPWNATVVRVAAVRHTAVRELVGEGVRGVLTVILIATAALLAVRLQARVGLRSDADAVTDLDSLLGLAPDTDGFANNLVADTAGLS